MIFGIFFAFWRILEILTIIPIIGMLAYFVHQYIQINALTPDSILVLFIVSVLAGAWAIYTLFTYHRSRRNALFVAFIDLCFVGAFIAGVYLLRGINSSDCVSIVSNSTTTVTVGALGTFSYSGLGVSADKTCSMLKASWALAIMNCIMFFFTSVLALFYGLKHERDDRRRKGNRSVKETKVIRETHVSRHGHRRSGSRNGGGGSHRSSHSRTRRTYV